MTKAEIISYSRKAKLVQKDDIIAEQCKGKAVLDVGCIGQDRNYKDETWLHNKVRKLAAKADGVDILINEIRELKQAGYSMYSVDELKFSGNRYDIVLMADVIEHVDDPVAFLKFYSEYLKPGGSMLITTPNANRANNVVHIFFNNNYSVNPEHTFWFCPRTFSEVVQRAGLTITEFFWADHYFDAEKVKGTYQRFKLGLINMLIRRSSNFSPNMIFILTEK